MRPHIEATRVNHSLCMVSAYNTKKSRSCLTIHHQQAGHAMLPEHPAPHLVFGWDEQGVEGMQGGRDGAVCAVIEGPPQQEHHPTLHQGGD